MIGRRLLAMAPPLLAVGRIAGHDAPGTAPHPDADLLRLGADLRRAQADLDAFDAAYPDGDLDEVMKPCSAIVACIELATAHTLDGLRVKAMAFAWCHGTNLDVLSSDAFCLDEFSSTDGRLADNIMRTLLALPDVMLTGRAP